MFFQNSNVEENLTADEIDIVNKKNKNENLAGVATSSSAVVKQEQQQAAQQQGEANA